MFDKQISFKIEARIVLQLGMTLIPDELTALLEMIKNSYDADATYVTITVDSNANTQYGKGYIKIKDNGNGMTPFILEDAFMKLATSFKQHVKVSPYFERRALGNKGIGRLSTQRLGKHLKVTTIPDVERLMLVKNYVIEDIANPYISDYKYVLDMNWGDLNSENEINMFKGDLTSARIDKKEKPGTEILIEGLNDSSYWIIDQFKINRIKSEVFGMTSIFSSINRNLFKFEMNVNGKKITNDAIDENVLKTSSDSYVYFSFKNWKLTLNIYRNNRYVNRRYEEFIRSQKNAKMSLNIEKSTKYDEFFKEFNHKLIEIDLLDNENIVSTKRMFSLIPELSINDKSIKEVGDRLAYPGSFDGAIFALDKSPAALTQLTDQINTLKLYEKGIRLKKEILTVWDNAQGFYVFKNNFRILPYGKKDWAGFDSLAMHNINNIFKSNNLAGYISIDGIDSENLKEQTNRSGLVLDNYGINFMTLIEEFIIKNVANEDKRFRNTLTLSVKKNDNEICTNSGHFCFKLIEEDSIKQKMDSTVEVIIKNIKSLSNENNSTDEVEINENSPDVRNVNMSNALKNIEKAADDLVVQSSEFKNSISQDKSILINELNQIRSIYPLAAQGIIVESLSHELAVTEDFIRKITISAIEDLNKRLFFNEPERLILHHSTQYHQISNKLDYLNKAINHISPMSKANLDIIEIFDVKGLVEYQYSLGSPLILEMNKKDINLQITGDSFKTKCAKGYLITIIDNLILNSIYWLDKVNVTDKQIELNFYDNGTIIFSDNGFGFDENIIDSVFEPFITSREEGRGLGLFICREIMDLINGRIFLDNVNRNKYNRIHSLILEFEVQ